MNKNKIKQILDYLPLLIIAFYAIRLPITLRETNIQVEWINITAYVFLIVTIGLFIWRHQLGVLALGLLLFLGLFGAVSFNPGISSFLFGLGKDAKHTLFNIYGDPTYILFLILHFILSGRYYVGIATKRYWKDLVIVCCQTGKEQISHQPNR